MSDEDVSSRPTSGQSIFSGGSDLFKTALNEYILDKGRLNKVEYERYNSKKKCKIIKSEDHVASERCDTCVAVKNLCKCDDDDNYIGHTSRVHWADEVWEKPLFTVVEFSDSEPEDSADDVDASHHHVTTACSASSVSKHLKPILKHRANCIIIVSN